VAFGRFFLMRILTAAWKSLRKKRFGFPTFTTGPTTTINMEAIFILKNYKGWLRLNKKIPFLSGAAGWLVISNKNMGATRAYKKAARPFSKHPVCAANEQDPSLMA